MLVKNISNSNIIYRAPNSSRVITIKKGETKEVSYCHKSLYTGSDSMLEIIEPECKIEDMPVKQEVKPVSIDEPKQTQNKPKNTRSNRRKKTTK